MKISAVFQCLALAVPLLLLSSCKTPEEVAIEERGEVFAAGEDDRNRAVVGSSDDLILDSTAGRIVVHGHTFCGPEAEVTTTGEPGAQVTRRTGPAASVPFALWGPGVMALRSVPFCESAAGDSDLSIEQGHTLLEFLLESGLGASPEDEPSDLRSSRGTESAR